MSNNRLYATTTAVADIASRSLANYETMAQVVVYPGMKSGTTLSQPRPKHALTLKKLFGVRTSAFCGGTSLLQSPLCQYQQRTDCIFWRYISRILPNTQSVTKEFAKDSLIPYTLPCMKSIQRERKAPPLSTSDSNPPSRGRYS